MKNGHCPMCNSNQVVTTSTVRFFASNNAVRLRDDHGNIVPTAKFVPYICMNCGFTAMYVDNMDDIKDLPKTAGWEQVK